ncbi:MAG: hypothetical protein ACKN9D_03450 [Actinomycetales bacterium]
MSEVRVVHGADSVGVSSSTVQAWVTLQGAQVAPVTFRQGERQAQPYVLAPWMPGEIPDIPPLLDLLRGDFFCLPFGSQPDGPLHGDPASAQWQVVEHRADAVRLAIDTTDTGARVEKLVRVVDDQTVLYQTFTITGLDGAFSYGTHPVIDFSQVATGTARLGFSPMRMQSVYPGTFSDPAQGEHQILAEGARFDDLAAVPLAAGGELDLTHYPTPRGHEDLVMLVNDPAAGPIGWAAATLDGFVWFSLKNICDFPATILWISNGGRSQPPWSGRFTGRMGIEDVCSYFAAGLVDSRADLLAADGIPTTRAFRADTPVTITSIQGVAFTEPGFGRVTDVDLAEPGQITLRDERGRTVTAAVNWEQVLPASPVGST